MSVSCRPRRWSITGEFEPLRRLPAISPSHVSRPQKSGLSPVGNAASCPGNHWVFSAQTASAPLSEAAAVSYCRGPRCGEEAFVTCPEVRFLPPVRRDSLLRHVRTPLSRLGNRAADIVRLRAGRGCAAHHTSRPSDRFRTDGVAFRNHDLAVERGASEGAYSANFRGHTEVFVGQSKERRQGAAACRRGCRH
jgi:hypothetical protein